MNTVKKLLLAIKMILKTPSIINLITNSEIRWEKYLAKKYSNKKQLPIVNIKELIPVNNSLDIFSFLGGSSLPTDILLLKEICKKFSNCSYFEIGTWRGESVINVAQVAATCYTLNLSKEEIMTMNLSEKYADFHGYFSRNKENIIHLYGNSMTFNFTAINKKFDVIFIDGNHHYDYVKNDTTKVFKYLTHSESIVIWHDYALHPEKIRNDVLAGILDGTPRKFHTNLYHVSNTLCAIYYPKTLKSSNAIFPVKPDPIFSLKLHIKQDL